MLTVRLYSAWRGQLIVGDRACGARRSRVPRLAGWRQGDECAVAQGGRRTLADGGTGVTATGLPGTGSSDGVCSSRGVVGAGVGAAGSSWMP